MVAIRVARPDDVVAVGALTAEAYLADGLIADEDDYAAELRDAQRRADEAVLLVAMAPTPDGREAVVGTITVAPYGSSYAEIAEPGEVELRMLAVAPEARHHGVAVQLMRAAQREALARDARRLVLSTLDAMAAAQRLYDRLGFVREPERDWGHEVVHLRVYTWAPPEAPGALVEAATWPAARTVVTADGWRAGLSGGFTRRANSALPSGRPADLGGALARVEAVYAAAGLPPTVRVGSGAPAGLGEHLSAHRYAERARTDVLVRAAGEVGPAAPGPGWSGHTHVADEPDDAWLRAFLGVKNGVDHADVARAVLTGAPAQYLTATSGGETVGTLRVAFAEQWAALSCLAVSPDARRHGLGRTLTRHGLALAARHGASRVFLQVEAANAAAAALYAQLGFVVADGYAYLVREDG
ncbi:GNAT family N-acetyltransferase [Cellulomonas sp. 73-92]|uniref:GNAT family N-acetyltransferase n=1 Tax=Cellulomonas sp. 73-92 TaxID=1895740 RepID=UPI000A90B127|nr:GNAT family N-acetyltransferase [Cellulomonas sp. 73-92]